MAWRRSTRWGAGIGIPALLIAIIIGLWNWDWFIPVVESRASAAVGRPVTVDHLHVRLGRTVRITADGVAIANPTGWHGPSLANVAKLAVAADLWDYIRHGTLVLPEIDLKDPVLRLVQMPNGDENYKLDLASKSSGSTMKIGDLRIEGGNIRTQLAKLKADFVINVETRQTGDAANPAQVVADLHGTYGGAPVSGKATGGALLSLRDPSRPWPIDLQLANGPTHLALSGTLNDPLHLIGAALKFRVAGNDVGQLEKLVGFPIPKTPPFRLTGALDFGDKQIRLHDFAGKLGSSDLEGTITVDVHKEKPEIMAELQSRSVDLADLGGFIGAAPGRITTPGQTEQQRKEIAQAEAKPNLLPEKPIRIPRLQWADLHIRYRGHSIQGRSVPLDNMVAVLDVVNGQGRLHPLSFGVGSGQIKATVLLAPRDNLLHAKGDIDFQRISVSRLMAATHLFHGAGTISGSAEIDTVGNSVGAMLGNGNGGVRLGMVGGDLSSLLVDLSGLQFGNALLSALGVPSRTQVECFIGDAALRQGKLQLQALVVDTGSSIVNGSGMIDLKDEKLDLQLRTDAKHFSIGSLPAPINVSGTFKKPAIVPGAEAAARGGLAAGLGVVFPPLAILPTIQFGVGEDHRCDRILAQAKREPGGQRLPPPKPRESAR